MTRRARAGAALAVTLGLAATPRLAAAQDLACPDTTGVQAALNECAARDFAEADDALNAVWGKVRTWAEDMDARNEREGFASEKGLMPIARLILEAQRGWLALRDGQCAAEAAWESGGSMWPMVFDGCRARLTRERMQELWDLMRPPFGIAP